MLCLHSVVLFAAVALLADGHPALILAQTAALGMIAPYLKIAAKLLGPASGADRMLVRAAAR